MTKIPDTIAELGPGDSIGIGIAALLSGCNHYNAFDVVEYTSRENNLRIFKVLVDLFEKQTSIPDDVQFPKMKPRLKSYAFPKHILTREALQRSLAPERLNCIKDSILEYGSHGPVSIKYRVPWFNCHNIRDDSVDLIYSQAVLEHVDNLQATYEAMYQWLNKDGFMSHQIDFKCHGTARKWNGHWAYNDLLWKLIRGKRPYLLNRQPFSRHLALLANVGFKVVSSTRVLGDSRNSGIRRKDLSRRFMNMFDEDLLTSSAHIVSVKR
ncbi:MAG: class I SAM-dependent methyltransferase [Desulfobacteraceae bacterium]|nr:class I SAM-dependent methyltransferase [Desulfobacteraceae bacterium]